MDVVAPPKPVAPEAPAPTTEAALATPPPQAAADDDAPAPMKQAPPAAQVAPATAKVTAPKAPGVDMAITATAIIIIVIAGLAVLAYIKR